MTEAKCTPVTATGSFFYESGAAGVDELPQQEPGLTAIFAMSDEMGAAVVNELQRRGLRVPEDVSVLGFDNTSTSLHVNPPLSTMAQPLEEMGRMAVKKLLRSRDLGPKIMPHRLIERGSTSGLSLPRCPVSSSSRAVSMTVLVSNFSSPSGPVRDTPRSIAIHTSSQEASAAVVSVWFPRYWYAAQPQVLRLCRAPSRQAYRPWMQAAKAAVAG
jgi:hypothetical protein